MALIKVRFNGIADRRELSKKDLAGAGVVVDKDLVWSYANGNTVVLDANDRLVEILRAEGHFILSAVNDDGSDTVFATASNPTTEGDTLVDGDTGASTQVKPKKS